MKILEWARNTWKSVFIKRCETNREKYLEENPDKKNDPQFIKESERLDNLNNIQWDALENYWNFEKDTEKKYKGFRKFFIGPSRLEFKKQMLSDLQKEVLDKATDATKEKLSSNVDEGIALLTYMKTNFDKGSSKINKLAYEIYKTWKAGEAKVEEIFTDFTKLIENKYISKNTNKAKEDSGNVKPQSTKGKGADVLNQDEHTQSMDPLEDSEGSMENVVTTETEINGVKIKNIKMSQPLQQAFAPNTWQITKTDVLTPEIDKVLIPLLKTGALKKIRVQATSHTNRNRGAADGLTWKELSALRVKAVKEYLQKTIPDATKGFKKSYTADEIAEMTEQVFNEPIEIDGKKWTPNGDGTLGPKSAFLNAYVYSDPSVKPNAKGKIVPKGHNKSNPFYLPKVLTKYQLSPAGFLGDKFYKLFTKFGDVPGMKSKPGNSANYADYGRALWESKATEPALSKINILYWDVNPKKMIPGSYKNIPNDVTDPKNIWTTFDTVAQKDVIRTIGLLYDPFITLYIFYELDEKKLAPKPPEPPKEEIPLQRRNLFTVRPKGCNGPECEVSF